MLGRIEMENPYFSSCSSVNYRFADDTELVSEEANGMKKSLECMVKWCDEWGVN